MWDLIPDCIKNRIMLVRNRIILRNFFSSSESKIIYCKIPSAELVQYLIDFQNPFKQASDLINTVSQLDLDYVDTQLISGKKLVYANWIDNWQDVRQALKFGYLIDNIKKQGQHTPMQLLSSSTPNKYAVHPGAARLSVLIAALEVEYCELIYCWNEKIDPHPFVFNYEFEEILSADSFLNLYNDNSLVFREDLNNKNQHRGYCRLQHNVLSTDIPYDFLTTFDQWDKTVEWHVRFKDVYKFYSNTSCTVAGVDFIKINDNWIKK